MKNDFSLYVTKYFAEYLPLHLGVAENTLKSYRDTFVLFLRFMESERRVPVGKMTFEAMTASAVEAFLQALEAKGARISTRNQRLAAIHSFFKYVQRYEPARFGMCDEILSIPFKKSRPLPMSYLSVKEMELIFSMPDACTRKGLRDLAILAVLYDAGARVQELIDLTASQLNLTNGTPYIELRGKGGKVRRVPISDDVRAILEKYLSVYRGKGQQAHVFFNSQNNALTRAGIQYVIDKNITLAKREAPDLFQRKITNHSFRHSKAMHLLEAGVNLVYIRDFLGHSSITTTEIYAKANPEIIRSILIENSSKYEMLDRYDSTEKDGLIAWLKSELVGV